MSKKRTVQLIANVEQDLANLAWRTKPDNLSMSAYLRHLVIADLKQNGALTSEMMEELV